MLTRVILNVSCRSRPLFFSTSCSVDQVVLKKKSNLFGSPFIYLKMRFHSDTGSNALCSSFLLLLAPFHFCSSTFHLFGSPFIYLEMRFWPVDLGLLFCASCPLPSTNVLSVNRSCSALEKCPLFFFSQLFPRWNFDRRVWDRERCGDTVPLLKM